MKRWFLLPTGSLIQVMLACGVLQICAYYVVATLATPGIHLAVPQPDTLLYCQSARQIAEGMPYVFSPGDKPSTGSTSHLYPFLLAALYKSGATGDALLTAGFALNAVFYLIFLANWGLIVRRLTVSPCVRSAACVLLALNGQAAYGALSQSDVGLFMAVSSGAFAALLSGQSCWWAALLVLAPWCRPEGMVMAVLYAGFLLFRSVICRQRVSRVEWGTAGAAIFSVIGIFAFNHGLTGYTQYQSIMFKGYFKQYAFFPAVNLTLSDAIRMGREFFLGQPEAMPREVFWLPFFGAVFGWAGVMLRPWRSLVAWKEVWWLVACGASLGLVASSGWQGMNTDRYLVWLLPVWLVYMAGGAVWLGRRFPRAGCWGLPLLVVMAFQALSAVWLCSSYFSACLSAQQTYDFVKEAHTLLPAGARVGCETASITYGFPKRGFVHLSGIYSPDLLTAEPVMNLERLKHRPELRFDDWVLPAGQAVFYGAPIDCLCGPVVTLGANGMQLRAARWGALDRALFPLANQAAGVGQTSGWRLVERLDVGYPEDEKRCAYETGNRFHGMKYEPFGYATNNLFEVGRVVVGWESMTLRLVPHRPVKVVLRTAAKVETGVYTGGRNLSQTFSFASPLQLRACVDGSEVGVYKLSLPEADAVPGMCEVSFVLPAESIQHSETRLTLYGDHASFAAWFYQPE